MSRHFRFDSIIKLRTRQRDSAALAVDEVIRAIRVIDDQLTDIQQEVSSLDGERKLASVGNIAVGQLMEIQRHQLMLFGNIQYLNHQRGKLLQEKSRRDHALLKAQQALKSLEKLRERRLSEAEIHDALRVQSRLDEWSNTRSVSNRTDKPTETT
jgi:flagellar export protein FliJ